MLFLCGFLQFLLGLLFLTHFCYSFGASSLLNFLLFKFLCSLLHLFQTLLLLLISLFLFFLGFVTLLFRNSFLLLGFALLSLDLVFLNLGFVLAHNVLVNALLFFFAE